MIRRLLIIAVTLCSSSMLAQDFAEPPRVFTVQQAEAGKRELAVNAFGVCQDCHTTALTGRIGASGEMPALSSIEDGMRQTVLSFGGKVPALVGPKFMSRWNARSTKDLALDFKDRFSGPLTEQTQLNIIAYLLQLNGALPGPQPLTTSTDAQIGKLISTTIH